MNIFRGILSHTNDRTTAIQSSLEGWKVLYLGDPCDENDLIMNYGFIVTMPLVPEYNILVKDVEGYTSEFDLEYVDMLGREPALSFFVSILTALFQGLNIMLYFPLNVSEFRYPSVLLQYITQQYGIMAGGPENPYVYYDRYNNTNLIFMYSYNTISHVDFLLYYDGPLDENLIDNLVSRIQPRLNNIYDYQEKYNAIVEYKATYIQIASTGQYPIDACHHDYGAEKYGGVKC